MPNPGGPYLGCGTCRRRRIKCDESRPQCRRCLVHGVTCPGYLPMQDAMFRHETERVTRRVSTASTSHVGSLISVERVKKNPRTSQSENTAPSGLGLGSPVFTSAHSEMMKYSLSIPTAPKMLDSITVTSYFFHQVVMPVGWFIMLPRLYQHSPDQGCLRLTVDAASMFLYSNWSENAQLLRKARTLYISALNAVNTVICDHRRRLEDETLHAILVLNILDEIMGENSFVSGTHIEGCRQLLMLRDAEGYNTSCTPELVDSVIIQTQSHLLRNSHIPWDKSKSRLTERDPLTKPAAALLDECVQVHQLRSVLTEQLLCASDDVPRAKMALYLLLNEVQAIDGRLKKWPLDVEERWTCKKTSHRTSAGELVELSYYQDLQVSKVWNQYRVARLINNEMQAEICGKLQDLESVSETQNLVVAKAASMETMASMLSDICSSIPFHLQKIDSRGDACSPNSQQAAGGMALLWPLETLLRCRYSNSYHQLLANTVLKEIGHVIGIRQALRELADISQ